MLNSRSVYRNSKLPSGFIAMWWTQRFENLLRQESAELGCWISSLPVLESMSNLTSRAAGVFMKNPGLRPTAAPPRCAAFPSRLLRSVGQLHSPAIQRASSATAGGPAYEALLLDVGGTLLETAKPVPEIYSSFGEKYGIKVTPDDMKKGFKKAFAEPWLERLRYEGDGRPFWRHAVATATGCSDEGYFEELYQHFAKGAAWKVADGALEGLVQLRDAGVKLAVVSNFDSRLRPVLRDLQVYNLFDSIIVSAEIGYEKPAPQIFEAALKELRVEAKQAVHVGDDATADKAGAQAIGIEAWLWKKDVKTFQEIVDRILDQGTHSMK